MRQKLLELVIRAEKKNRNLKAKINISIWNRRFKLSFKKKYTLSIKSNEDVPPNDATPNIYFLLF